MTSEETQLKWLESWMQEDMDAGIIDLIFEYLSDQDMLTKEGKQLAHEFWEKHIKEAKG